MSIEKYKETLTFIYTDASKKGKRTGFGINVPDINFKFSRRLSDILSICKAEIIAIHDAVKYVINKRLKNMIIFSDASSAIKKLTKTC